MFSKSLNIVFFSQADTSTQSPFDKAVVDALNNIEAGAKKFQEVTGIKTEFDKSKVEAFLKGGLGDSRKKIEELLKNLETNVSENFHINHGTCYFISNEMKKGHVLLYVYYIDISTSTLMRTLHLI